MVDMSHARMLRFLVVGMVNTGFSFGLYLLLVWAGLHFAVANFLATVAGILFSFRTQGIFVYGNRDWRLLLRFVPVWLLIYCVNVALIAVFVRMGVSPYVGGLLALPPTVALSYFTLKWFVFPASAAPKVSSPKP